MERKNIPSLRSDLYHSDDNEPFVNTGPEPSRAEYSAYCYAVIDVNEGGTCDFSVVNSKVQTKQEGPLMPATHIRETRSVRNIDLPEAIMMLKGWEVKQADTPLYTKLEGIEYREIPSTLCTVETVELLAETLKVYRQSPDELETHSYHSAESERKVSLPDERRLTDLFQHLSARKDKETGLYEVDINEIDRKRQSNRLLFWQPPKATRGVRSTDLAKGLTLDGVKQYFQDWEKTKEQSGGQCLKSKKHYAKHLK